ncbi:MAG: hypothetical protein GF364_15185 [Candidatus Lokiarchaeota archaeon]|nr:hypothetical protein [Candidatus Lokiarchaeota archaeon]
MIRSDTVMMKLDSEKFNQLLNERIKKIQDILGNKAKEYSCHHDRLHNFRIASNMIDDTMAKALWGMALKHLVSVDDIVNKRLDWSNKELVDEKIGDMINYLILLEAVIEEWRINNAM